MTQFHPRFASTTIVTENISATKQFYERHLDARPIFNCGWYVQLALSDTVEICLMAPQSGQPAFTSGAMVNLLFEDVDGLHTQLVEQSVEIAIPLEDHPWGDRGFGFTDPSGMMVYCYRPIPAAPEFQEFYVENSDIQFAGVKS